MHLDHLGMHVLRRAGSRPSGPRWRRRRGALEQRLGHLRAAGVLDADEEDAAHRRLPARPAGTVGDRAEAAPTPGRRGRPRSSEVAGAIAGPSERAGFIEAPVIGPPNIASRPTVPPIAIAAASPTARVSVATAMITNIRKKVSTTSHRNAWPSEPAGRVAPTWAMSPSEPRRTSAAATAPASCAAQ